MNAHLSKGVMNLFAALSIIALMGPSILFGQKIRVGDPAPDFAVPSLEGERTIRLSDFRGRRVLIFTWASW